MPEVRHEPGAEVLTDEWHWRLGRPRRAPRRVVNTLPLLLLLVGRASPAAAADEPQEIQVPPPPFSEGIFPCSGCHSGLPVNRQRRKLTEMHADIVLKHGPESRWCLDCHAAEDRDTLHLASGEAVPFTASYLLCGQCHGEKLRDWKVGVHGKRTGDWNGRKQYLLCAHCHDPHSPRFKPLKPLPPPVRPEQIRPARGGAR
jgi:hypothetical protein